MKIVDGQTGNTARVDENLRLHVDSLSKTVEHQSNHEHGLSFSASFSATPTGAGDCFFYLKNTDERDLIVEGINLWMLSNQYYEIKTNLVGTPAGGSAITPYNLNSGSGKSATGIFQSGNDITGLSGGRMLYRIHHETSNKGHHHNFDQDIILPKNATLAICVETGAVALDGFIDFFYHDVKH